VIINISSYIFAGYSIIWNGKRINVYRSDVVCTNGIIHVIEHPFIEEKDIQIAYSGAYALSAILLPSIISFILSRFFM
jgi:fasciclin 1